MRAWLTLAGLLLVLASVWGYTVSFGDSLDVPVDLSGGPQAVTIVVDDIPADVNYMYVSVSPSVQDRVFCAPSYIDDPGSSETFTCMLLGDSDYTADVKFVGVDANTDTVVGSARVTFSADYELTWYRTYASAPIGGSFTAGQYTVSVEDAETVSADILVTSGQGVVWSGVMFVGQEVELSQDFRLVFNGYSERRGQAYFTVVSTSPVAVVSSSGELYLAVPPVVYEGTEFYIVTSCKSVSVCSGDDCEEFEVEDGRVSLELNAGEYTVSCSVGDLSEDFEVKEVPVKTKVVEKQADPGAICPSWFRSLTPEQKTAMCSASPASPAGPDPGALLLIVLALGLGYVLYRKYQSGELSLSLGGGGKDVTKEPEKEIEAVREIE